MTEPNDLRELVGDDVSPAELERLREVDAILRAVPGPPELPPALADAVSLPVVRARREAWRSRRTLTAVAAAAALAAVSFGLGTRAGGGEEFSERAAIEMQAGVEARSAAALLRVGETDSNGNWPLRLEVSGLEPLPPGGYYALWLAKDGEYAATCGSFRMGEGETEAEWTVSYPLDEYDAWVVTAYLPDEPRDTKRPWLLQADIDQL